MKDLKSNIEQTCIEFGKFVYDSRISLHTNLKSIDELWQQFQEQQAKKALDILDDNGIDEPVCESLEDAITLADRYNEYLDEFKQLNGEHKCMMTFVEYMDIYKDDRLKESVEETAEEFYKDHFGHTSQHVSMDKIFVCMELYAMYKKGKQYQEDFYVTEGEEALPETKQMDIADAVAAIEPWFYSHRYWSESEKVAMETCLAWIKAELHDKEVEKKHTTRTGGLSPDTGPRN